MKKTTYEKTVATPKYKATCCLYKTDLCPEKSCNGKERKCRTWERHSCK